MGERGFTLIELVVATVIIVGLSLFSLFFLLTPAVHTEENLASERRAEVAYIAQSLRRYVTATGQLPPELPTKLTAIGNAEQHYDLCAYIVPEYGQDLPIDPTGGVKTAPQESKATNCNDQDVTYASGYAIMKNRDNSVTITAPFAEAEETPKIELTIDPLG